MKYFMTESTFHDPLPVSEAELQMLIQEHLHYLERVLPNTGSLFQAQKQPAGEFH